VAVDTFTNPIKGVSTVFRKVAERAKAEKEKSWIRSIHFGLF
jgi:hypothetical protein